MPNFFFSRSAAASKDPPMRKGVRSVTAETSADHIIDIVFVHGLTGDATETWTTSTSPKIFWPKDFLQFDIPEARILTYGYNAQIIGNASQSRMALHAKDFAYELQLYRKATKTEHRPIIFACHSLGGLLVECALSFTATEHASALANLVYAIAFFGTPHSGAGKAEFARTVVSLAKPFVSTQFLRVLERESDILFSIEESFHSLLMRPREPLPWKKVHIVNFYEQRHFRGLASKIVEDTSANMKGYDSLGIDADHRGMTKFADREDSGYRKVQLVLKDWVENYKGLQEERASLVEQQRAKEEQERTREAQVEEARAEELRDKIQEWLRAPKNYTFEESYEELLRSRHNGTGQWIESNEVIKEWLNSKKNAVVWVKGIPGAGKTVLTASLVKRLRQEGQDVVYFFCSFLGLGTDDRAMVTLLQSLAAQLLVYTRPLLIGTKNVYLRWQRELSERYGCGPSPECAGKEHKLIETLKEFIITLLNHGPKKKFMLVDGLDEVNDLGDAIDALKFLWDCPIVGTAKWLISSRETHQIESRFMNNRNGDVEFTTLDLRTTDLSEDIRLFLRENILDKFKPLLEDFSLQFGGLGWMVIQEVILVHATEKTDGCFLYAKLLAQHLETAENPLKILEAYFKNTFPQLDELYSNTLKRAVDNCLNKELLQDLIRIIIIASVPLRLSEIRDALGSSTLTAPLPAALRSAADALASFIAYQPADENPIFRVAHATVKEFFIGIVEKDGGRPFGLEAGNLMLGKTCLDYLRNAEFARPLPYPDFNDWIRLQHPFLKYAAIFWHKHLDVVPGNDKLCEKVVKFWSSPNFRTCIQVQSLYAPYLFAQYQKADKSVSYADNLPGWIENYSAENQEQGKSVAYANYLFMKEWGYFVQTHPDKVERCFAGLLGPHAAQFCGKGTDDSFCLDDQLQGVGYDPETITQHHVLAVSLDGTITAASIRQPKDRSSNLIELTQWTFDGSGSTIPEPKETQSLSLPNISTNPGTPGCAVKTGVQISQCNTTVCIVLKGQVFQFPIAPKSLLWRLVGIPGLLLSSILTYIGVHSPTELGEYPTDAIWRLSNKSHIVCIGADWQSNESPVSEPCSTRSHHSVYTSKDSDGGGGGGGSGETDTESDSDSDSDSDSEGSSSGGYYARRYRMYVLDCRGFGRASPYLHSCLVQHPTGSLVSPVFHQSRPLVAWSCGLVHVCIVDYQNRREERIPLDFLGGSEVLSSEARFSVHQDYLYFAAILQNRNDQSSGSIVVRAIPLSELKAKSGGDAEPAVTTTVPWKLYRRTRHRQGKNLYSFTWTETHLFVSFSTWKLSVLRISLPPAERTVATLNSRPYLPASSQSEPVRFYPIHPRIRGQEAALVLPWVDTKRPPAFIMLPDLQWDLVGPEQTVDYSCQEELAKKEFYEASESTFSVSVRSGDMWTDRSILLCGNNE